MYKEREYSLVDPIFSAEAAMLSPEVFKPKLTLDTQNPLNGPPGHARPTQWATQTTIFIFNIEICYSVNKTKGFKWFSKTFLDFSTFQKFFCILHFF